MDALYRRLKENLRRLEQCLISTHLMSLLQKQSVKTHASQLWRFIICGGLGSVLDLSSQSVFIEFGHIDPYVASICSSIVGATFVFFLNKFFTFKNREHKTGSQAFKFMMVYGVSLVSNIAITSTLLWLGVFYTLAKIIAIGCGAIWNYALSHGFVFKKKEDIDVVVA